jgi:hypothetical protein
MSFKTAESIRSPNPLKPLFGDTMSTIILNALNHLTKLISRGDFATNAIEEVQETYGLNQEQVDTVLMEYNINVMRSRKSDLTLTICLKNASSVEIELTPAQFNMLMAQFNTGYAKDPNGNLIVRSIEITDNKRIRQHGYAPDGNTGYNWSYASTGRMDHPSDK